MGRILVESNRPLKGLEKPILFNARCTRLGLAATNEYTLFALHLGFECGYTRGAEVKVEVETSAARVVVLVHPSRK